MNIEQARFNMIEQQIRPWDVLDKGVLGLLAVVRREDFVPPTWRALAFSSARARTSLSGTPSQRALPIAPLYSCPPVTRGENSPRPLPEH